MIRNIFLTIVFTSGSFVLFAQDRFGDGQIRERLQEFTKQELTTSLNLSEKQQDAFFPIYDAFMEERMQLRKEIKELLDGALVQSDDALKGDFNKVMELKKRDANLEMAYMDRFDKVLTLRQKVALIQAEEEIKKKFLRSQIKGRMQRGLR
jgi:hypothetical protein